ncbi:hypothetical protein HMPREF1650_07905 [Corynebacterium freneyi DNF00450]|uniref:Pirin C-terminal domain-containing protein n=1 Tax=Corynebacterium freneyi DNF00450 TaxID=1287475 RepID=A0A096A695_9CORY|nr:hypothetical protein HMPREF1650_07905 [Corynebacterium freneyi DNF00450]
MPPLTIGTSGTTLRVGRIPAGGSFDVPLSRFTHFFVASGSVTLDGTTLYDGDVACITADPNSSTSIESLAATVVVNAEVLVRTMDRGIG